MREDNRYQGQMEEAGALLGDIAGLYAKYAMRPPELKRGFGNIFMHWVRGYDASADESADVEFVDSVEALTASLARALDPLKSDMPDFCDDSAWRVAGIMLSDKRAGIAPTAKLYITAAEYAYRNLLGFLSGERLIKLRGEYIKNTPKRRMLPKQRELYELMNGERESGAARPPKPQR